MCVSLMMWGINIKGIELWWKEKCENGLKPIKVHQKVTLASTHDQGDHNDLTLKDYGGYRIEEVQKHKIYE